MATSRSKKKTKVELEKSILKLRLESGAIPILTKEFQKEIEEAMDEYERGESKLRDLDDVLKDFADEGL